MKRATEPATKRKPRVLAWLPTAMLLWSSGCALGTDAKTEPGAEGFCAIAVPIYPSADDTPETLRQIAGYLEAGKALCGWQPPAEPAAEVRRVFPYPSRLSIGNVAPEPMFCASPQLMLNHLAERWHEDVQGAGIDGFGRMTVLLTSGGGNTWTIVTVEPSRGKDADRSACLLLAGRNWGVTLPSK